MTVEEKRHEALRRIEGILTDYLLEHTDDGQGFEAIPEIDEARTIALEALA